MRILGIDPGSRRTGFGIIERSGSRCLGVEYGTLNLGAGDMHARLLSLHRRLDELIRRARVDALAVESVFQGRNPSSALKLGQARGVVLVVAGLNGVEIAEYAPAQVKQAVTSSGRAEKEQVQRMVQMILGLSSPPPQDAADALAVAICHANHRRRGLVA